MVWEILKKNKKQGDDREVDWEGKGKVGWKKMSVTEKINTS